MKTIARVFPFVGWLSGYRVGHLQADLVAGVTVALVLVPQSMAYAQLAGLPVYYGLYASFLPPMIASLFGSSRQLATGPVAIVSLMTAAALEPLARTGGQEYIAYAILLALLIGLFQLVLGILRLGMVVNFLSHPVINGFTNAAALIIATSQLSKLFGVAVRKGEHHYVTVYNAVVDAVAFIHWPTVGMAALSFGTMILLRRLSRRTPNVLVAVALTTLISTATHYEKNATVEMSSFGSPGIKESISKYDELVGMRIEAETLRSEMNKKNRKGAAADQTVCSACHSKRALAGFREGGPMEAVVPREKVLSLHFSAGLINSYISELKEASGHVQEGLKRMQLLLVRPPDGGARFFLRGEVPDGMEPEGGIWRIRVNNAAFGEDGIPLMGGGAVVGAIPRGLPALRMPDVDWGAASQLFLMAAIISLLGFMEAVSIAKAMAARTHQRLDPNQELIGQGLANIVGAAGQSYAVSGSFSRSAVNLQSGAVSGLSNVFSSAMVVATLLFMTPLLYNLPQAVLASIIMMAVFGLLNVRGFVHAWQANRFDGITAVACFVTTLVFAPHLQWGIAIGVVFALGAYLYRTMRPHVAELSLHPDGSLRDAARHGLDQCKHIAVIRFDGPLNFANASYLEDEILGRVATLPDLRYVLIVGHGINEMDASGEETLSHLLGRLRDAGYRVVFSGLKENVLDVIARTHLDERIGRENMFPTQALALAAIHADAHIGSDERECPLLRVVRLGEKC